MFAERFACQKGLTRAHPRLVSTKRVDLAVVRNAPIRMRTLPCRERIGAEPRVNESKLAPRVVGLQIKIESIEALWKRETLVDDRTRRQTRNVKRAEAGLGGLATGALSDHEQSPLERRDRAHAADEDLAKHRH